MGGARGSFKGLLQNQILQFGKVSGWLRLAQSGQSGGEWTPSIVDILNAGSPVTQTGTDRRAAVGSSANGLPTMVFDGTDMHIWPQSPSQSSTTKVGIWFWYKPATVTGLQWLIGNALAVGSTHERFEFYANGDAVSCGCYITDTNGRTGTTPAASLVAGAWHAIYRQYDSSRGGDANLAIFINGVSQGLTYTNIGAGGTLTTLQAANGGAMIGGASDTDTPSFPIANGGQIGPNIFAFNDNLTVAEELIVRSFEAPT
jgi:hypothetical protein